MTRVTVFTPTFNRANLLQNVYESLKKQTYTNFEWLIIDDGSTDDTKKIVESFIEDAILDIVYIYQENRGQYFAHNTAAKNANSDLFAFLDSDDYYSEIAIERLVFYFDQIKNDDSFAGVAGLKADKYGNVIGGSVKYNVLDSTIIDYRYKHKYKGDKLECFKTRLVKENLFPEFDGKYVPNALVWNRISHKLKLRFFSEIIHYYEWSDDSMSKTIVKNRQSTPDAYLLYYSELSKYDIPLFFQFRSAVNYWRFAPYSEVKFVNKLRQIGLWKTIFSLPFGLFFYIRDLNIK